MTVLAGFYEQVDEEMAGGDAGCSDESLVDAWLWQTGWEDIFLLNYWVDQQQICCHLCDCVVVPPEENMPPGLVLCLFVFFQPAHFSPHPFLRIYQHIMLHLHISPRWSFLKCYFKSLIKNPPAGKRGKKETSVLTLTLCGLSSILKVMNEPRTQRIWNSPDFDNHIKRHESQEGGRKRRLSWSHHSPLCLCKEVEGLRGACSMSHVERRMQNPERQTGHYDP